VSVYSLDGVAPILPEDGDYWIAPDAAVIGKVRLLKGVSIWFGAVLRGDMDDIVIGEGSNIQDLSVLHADPGAPLTVGKGCVIGHRVMLHGCTIGDHSLIGIGATVLNRAKVGKNCIIGAHALITEGKVIPDNSLAVGAPARGVRALGPEDLDMLAHGGSHYVENARRFKKGLKLVPER
jgi:carbonic anhydrase/acetyltransferase-like protein (isoleucine patch superfamily)